MRVNCEEILAPVVGGTPYEDVGKAIRGVDTSAYGLQAGTSTNDVCVISKAFQEPEVGGLSVNEVLTWRIDHVPYGRVMQSGFRREGIRYAIEEMTELKMLMLHIG